MKRLFTALLALGLVCAATGALRADVKTQEKTQIKFEGMLGRMMGMFGGKAAKEGVVSTVAVKGDRLMRVTDTTGQIIDLAEEKVYNLDMKKKTYTVTTFAELRQKMQEAQAKAEKATQEQPEAKEQPAEKGKEMEVDFDVKQTGQTKTIAGHDTKEYIVTITVRQKGETLEDGGGMVMTADTWMADKIPALSEVADFNRRYYEKLGEPTIAGGSEEQMAAAAAMYPGMKAALEGLQKQNVKMEGSPLETTLTLEGVKSKEEMTRAQQSGGEGSGGLGGMFARKLMHKKEESPRSTVFTSHHEVLSVDASASDADVALPTGFKEKK